MNPEPSLFNMKLCIPDLGDKLLLTQPWTANLEPEQRNKTVLKHFFHVTYPLRLELERQCLRDMEARHPRGENHLAWHAKDDTPKQAADRAEYRAYRAQRIAEYKAECEKMPMEITIETGKVLIVDRIYIRKGAEGFSSVTFKWHHLGKVFRFWVPLEQANQIKFTKLDT